MKGLMQDGPLTLSMIFRRAEQLFGGKRIATAMVGGSVTRVSYARLRTAAGRGGRPGRA